MRLQSLDEFQREPDDYLCRERRAGRVAAAIAFGVCAVAFLLVALYIEQASKPAGLVSLCCAICVFTQVPGIMRAWRTDPWVVCIRASGLALNLRSCRNADRSATDRVVVWLDWKEIRSAGESSIELRLPDPDNWRDHRHREQYLELELTHARTEELERALAREFASGNDHRIHYFVPTLMLWTSSRIRVCWKDELRSLRPRLADVIQRMTLPALLRDSEHDSIDWRQLGPSEIEALLEERFRGGHHLQVVRLLRKQRGWSQKRAEQFVSEMKQRAGPVPDAKVRASESLQLN